MKKQLFILLLVTASANCKLLSQAPEIEWQNTIGGGATDHLYDLQQTTDGGYILGGLSTSNISGDKSENSFGLEDYWLIKLDAAGNILWQKTYGGSGIDSLQKVRQTPDGGYIMAGISGSGLSGNKTETAVGGFDYWVIKTDAAGNIIWQNTIGGNADDFLVSIDITSDGGYVLGGYSFSGISGDKTEICQGQRDYWIIKIDGLGNIIWQNTIGGTSDDFLFSILQTTDGGYFAGGWSSSGISGDKTVANYSSIDFWILKLDNSGNIIWQKSIGGTSTDLLYPAIRTSDGGFLLVGSSSSGISGNKTESNYGLNDAWIVKIDIDGNIEWQKTIGGTMQDYGYCSIQMPDGYLVGGFSSSPVSGNKTAPKKGKSDYWIIKLDNDGNIVWQETVGGNNNDYSYSFYKTSDNGFVCGGYSASGISGNKLETVTGPDDIWIVKFEGNCIPLIETCNSLDDNCNGLIDDGITESISISAGGATTFCQGGSTLLTASYSGASVQWKKNGSNIPGAISSTYSVNKSGNYSAVTTSPCGTATSSIINVIVNKNPNASISAGGATTFCAGESVTLTEIPVAGCTYQWYKGASLIAGATSTNYIATTAGNYKCRVTKIATGCYKNSNAISVTVPCKEGEWEVVNGEVEFKISPNPNSGTFEISVQNLAPASHFFEGGLRGMNLDLFNSLGQLIYSEQLNSSDNNYTETISLDNISSGIYFVRIGDGNNYAEQKLIIE